MIRMVAGDCQSFGDFRWLLYLRGKRVTLRNGTVGVWEI
jgi:hypothetical protein